MPETTETTDVYDAMYADGSAEEQAVEGEVSSEGDVEETSGDVTGDEAAESENEVDPDADADDLDEVELTDEEASSLKESAKAKVSKRIGDITRKLTDSEQAREALAEQASAMESELEALRAQVDRVSRGEVLQSAGIDPLFSAQDESEVVDAETSWRQIKRFTQRHVNSDLGQNDAGEIIACRAKDSNGNPVEYTRDQVFARLEQAEDMLDAVIPKARKLLDQRRVVKESASKVFPELFKKDSEESKVYTNALRAIPGLSTLPNAPILVGDMILGQKLRSPDVKEVTVGGRTFVLKNAGAAVPVSGKKVPKLPAKPVPAGSSPVARKKAATTFDSRAIMESADPMKAAEEQYLNII